MAKSKKKKFGKSNDTALMLLAAAAALIVGFFAIFAYKNQPIMPLPSPTPSVVTVALDTQNKSGESGTATLQEVNGQVVVTLNMAGFPKGIEQPAHIHLGSCPNPGAIKYPLTSVMNGTSTTTLNVTMDQLKSMMPLAINVHKSVAQSSTYYSCGDVTF
ncbi:MAG TPA: hypothetical protein VG895_01585 [Patescibacteria group bacterium]|nr:hypothetical protein [Patescibacteria group bacterium]